MQFVAIKQLCCFSGGVSGTFDADVIGNFFVKFSYAPRNYAVGIVWLCADGYMIVLCGIDIRFKHNSAILSGDHFIVVIKANANGFVFR